MRTTIRLVALVSAASIALAACGGAAATPAPATAPPATAAPATEAPATAAPTEAPATAAPVAFKACMVSDTGGIDDNSFNENAWKGMEDAKAKLGVEVKFLESRAATDYEKNINQFISEKCDMIVTVGFLLGDATKAAAEANPNIRFAIVDFAYDPAIPNVEGLVYTTNEAAMLAGYVSAGMSKSGTMGTFGGINIGGGVTDFMDGFVAGANYYNKEAGKSVSVLGWDAVKKEGSFTGNFDSLDDAKALTVPMLQEGADVILPVGGPIGGGAYTALQETPAEDYGIGVDVDWVQSAPQYRDVLLTSVLKKIDVSVTAAVERAVKGETAQAVFVSTLANGGVDLGPFNDFDAKVPQALKDGVAALKAKIISGEVKVADYFAAQ
ncbi:MAG TPA: BMP family ABC transporter substrate-binding protein [Candidatus Limnocylindrales bacterium]|nr:BMP family ABC transporter substrate-binding protein [Candidatus Limnocylindrales bacterium]